jgi:quercetin dioxygenase-like cupin family protein
MKLASSWSHRFDSQQPTRKFAMAIPHALAGQVIDVRPLGNAIPQSVTTTLVKTKQLEVIRLVLPAGKEIPTHQVAGEITVHCLEGEIEFRASGPSQVLSAGELLFLSGNEPHYLKSIQDASVLVTIQLDRA